MTQPEHTTVPEWIRQQLKQHEKKNRQKGLTSGFAVGGPVKPLPLSPLPIAVASSTARALPFNPFQIQGNRLTSIQQQAAATQPQLRSTAYIPLPVKQVHATAQARKELGDKALEVADKAAMTLPLPYVGETVGVLGAGIGAGIRGLRAIEDVGKGNYSSALDNAGNAVSSMAFPWLIARAKPALSVATLKINPIFSNSLAQREADAGAEWSRNWFRGRANASVGGLTPKDAAMSAAIKRPLVPSVPQWKALGNNHHTHGSYYYRPDMATVSPIADDPFSTAVHETTHQYQQAMRNAPAMKQGLGLIKEQMPPWNGPMTNYDRYWTKPDEVHARLTQLRQKFGYRPDEYITKERVLKDIDSHLATTAEKPYLETLFDSGLRRTRHLWPNQLADWLNNTPGVALPVAVGASAVVGSSMNKR